MRGLIDDVLRERINAGTERIERIDIDGRILWIKRPETLSFRMRLQKGDPQAAFAEEVAAHQALFAKGLPVAPIVSVGPDHIVTEDCGPHIQTLHKSEPAKHFRLMIQAAARALAKLHDAKETHGRPNLKDICWDDGRINFLDFERMGREKNFLRAQEMDVLIFLFSICAVTRDAKTMAAAKDAYRGAMPDVWPRAVSRLRHYLPLRYALWPVTRALQNKKEFGAVEPFFNFMLESK